MVGHREKQQTITNLLIVTLLIFLLSTWSQGSLGLCKIIITLLGIKALTCICDGVL